MSTDALADAVVTWAFDMDEKYDLGFTNSPDMHPDKPYIADFTMDLDDLVERIVAARVSEALAPIKALDDDICGALMAAKHGSYDGRSAEKHLERLLDKFRAALPAPEPTP